MIDHAKLQTLVKQTYATVNELEAMFPGRHFTPDGQMVDSLGERLVADAYRLELKTAPASNRWPPETRDGRRPELRHVTNSTSRYFLKWKKNSNLR